MPGRAATIGIATMLAITIGDLRHRRGREAGTSFAAGGLMQRLALRHLPQPTPARGAGPGSCSRLRWGLSLPRRCVSQRTLARNFMMESWNGVTSSALLTPGGMHVLGR